MRIPARGIPAPRAIHPRPERRGFSRNPINKPPVYEERVDRIFGTLHVLDRLGEPDERPITDFIRDAQYVPASQGVRELLLQLRKVGEVVDEFGAAEGIIAVEEVVEDLSDEYDTQDRSNCPVIR
jgi:Mg2+/Co2+ transporter CorC